MPVFDYQITIAPKNGFKHGLKISNNSPPTSIKFLALIMSWLYSPNQIWVWNICIHIINNENVQELWNKRKIMIVKFICTVKYNYTLHRINGIMSNKHLWFWNDLINLVLPCRLDKVDFKI